MTYAYLAFLGPHPGSLPLDLRHASPGSLIEVVMGEEDQPTTGWGVHEWDLRLLRNTPVQLSRDWDALDWAQQALGFGTLGADVGKVGAKITVVEEYLKVAQSTKDEEVRLLQVVASTLRIPNPHATWIFLVGTWGFDYDANQCTAEASEYFHRAGWLIGTRRPNEPEGNPNASRLTPDVDQSVLDPLGRLWDEIVAADTGDGSG